ncbi:MAG: LEA type 2 family protein [Polyangiaceae bacterium]|nr:LEA type 2 family protein [Polyangiaceae bacterium]
MATAVIESILVPMRESFRRAWRGSVARVAMFSVALCVCGSPLSCGSTPTLEVYQADVKAINLTGIVVDVMIKIHNSNGFDIQVRSLVAQTTIAGQYQLPPIHMQPNLWLPAKGTTSMIAPVTIPWQMVPGLLAATANNEKIPYRVEGYADVTATQSMGIKLNNEKLSDQGEIPRDMLLSFARPRLGNVN